MDNNTEVVDSSESDTSEEDLIISTLSMQERLALAIKKTDTMVVEKKTPPLNTINLTKIIRKEIVSFEENRN